MFVNPRRAFVGKPSVVASSSGSAKNARYARLLPSTRKSSASRAGASSSSSSRPVRVFGDIHSSVLVDSADAPDPPAGRLAAGDRDRAGRRGGGAAPPPGGGPPPRRRPPPPP